MIDRRNFIASIFASSIASDEEPTQPGSKKAHCKLYWVDTENKIWGMTHRGEIIEIHHHAKEVKTITARP